MHDWKSTLIDPDRTIRQALDALDKSSLQVVMVVDSQDRLLGMVTDGDVRRAILKNTSLDAPVREIMFTDFTAASTGDSRENLIRLMREKEIRHVPVLDDQGRVIDLKVLLDMVGRSRRDNLVVLMAGGLGTRLAPLTEDCPKPLLKVGGRPILEIILQSFKEYGFHRFLLSVNYKSEMVEEHFGDGSAFGVDIDYLRETERLGTAGCLGLLPERPGSTFLVMNGDLLTRINFDHLLEFHSQNKTAATMGIREYDIQVPFGVVEVEGSRLRALTEKPTQTFFVNAGVYALEPAMLDLMDPDQPLDMPELFQRAMDQGLATGAFPIHEYWLDIGRIGDYDRANGDYQRHFEK